jgi:hypothetical protein
VTFQNCYSRCPGEGWQIPPWDGLLVCIHICVHTQHCHVHHIAFHFRNTASGPICVSAVPIPFRFGHTGPSLYAFTRHQPPFPTNFMPFSLKLQILLYLRHSKHLYLELFLVTGEFEGFGRFDGGLEVPCLMYSPSLSRNLDPCFSRGYSSSPLYSSSSGGGVGASSLPLPTCHAHFCEYSSSYCLVIIVSYFSLSIPLSCIRFIVPYVVGIELSPMLLV